jgi:PilZ domain-containing protein
MTGQTDRRRFPRIRRRYPVEFRVAGKTCSGFTHNLSPMGLFVCSTYLPKPGTPLSIEVQVPGGNKFTMGVKVVRSYRVPQRLARFVPSGFSVRFDHAPEEYFQLLARLFRIAA